MLYLQLASKAARFEVDFKNMINAGNFWNSKITIVTQKYFILKELFSDSVASVKHIYVTRPVRFLDHCTNYLKLGGTHTYKMHDKFTSNLNSETNCSLVLFA